MREKKHLDARVTRRLDYRYSSYSKDWIAFGKDIYAP